MEGKIIKIVGNLWIVSSSNNNYECLSPGKLKYNNINLLVGDTVTFDKDTKVIEKVLPRKNSLIRPPISNVDQAIVVVSCKEPALSLELLDKLLLIIEHNNIKPIICFTKYDLLNNSEKKEILKYKSYYEALNYNIFINDEVNNILKLLKNNITVLAGQTGVGKSTLLNTLDKKLHLKTGVVSKIKRGKHTTRCVELLKINNGLIADTPGFSQLSFINMTKEDIKKGFREIQKYKSLCKYSDCDHINEDRCAIKDKVLDGIILESRYINYKKFIEEKGKENIYD